MDGGIGFVRILHKKAERLRGSCGAELNIHRRIHVAL